MRERFSPLVERVSGKGAQGWELHRAAVEAKAAGRDVIVMSIGDPEFSTSPAIADTAVEAIRSGDTHYPEVQGRYKVRKAVAQYVNHLSATSHGAENVVLCNGTQNALFNVSLALFTEGDEVIMPDPAYLTYEATLRVGGAKLVPVPLRSESGFALDISAIAQSVTPRTKAIMVNSPANPTGAVATRDEVAGLAALARENDLWVVSDEVYADLIFEGQHRSIASAPEMVDRSVIVGGLSKSHAMTGWRIGWAVGPVDLINHMERINLAMTYGLPGFIQQAALTALRADDEVAAMREIYRRRRDLVVDQLSEAPGLVPLVPGAGMFVFVDVRGTGMTSNDFAWELFESTGVAVLDGANFGQNAQGWVRMSFAIDETYLAEACRRVVDFCQSLLDK